MISIGKYTNGLISTDKTVLININTSKNLVRDLFLILSLHSIPIGLIMFLSLKKNFKYPIDYKKKENPHHGKNKDFKEINFILKKFEKLNITLNRENKKDVDYFKPVIEVLDIKKDILNEVIDYILHIEENIKIIEKEIKKIENLWFLPSKGRNHNIIKMKKDLIKKNENLLEDLRKKNDLENFILESNQDQNSENQDQNSEFLIEKRGQGDKNLKHLVKKDLKYFNSEIETLDRTKSSLDKMISNISHLENNIKTIKEGIKKIKNPWFACLKEEKNYNIIKMSWNLIKENENAIGDLKKISNLEDISLSQTNNNIVNGSKHQKVLNRKIVNQNSKYLQTKYNKDLVHQFQFQSDKVHEQLPKAQLDRHKDSKPSSLFNNQYLQNQNNIFNNQHIQDQNNIFNNKHIQDQNNIFNNKYIQDRNNIFNNQHPQDQNLKNLQQFKHNEIPDSIFKEDSKSLYSNLEKNNLQSNK